MTLCGAASFLSSLSRAVVILRSRHSGGRQMRGEIIEVANARTMGWIIGDTGPSSNLSVSVSVGENAYLEASSGFLPVKATAAPDAESRKMPSPMSYCLVGDGVSEAFQRLPAMSGLSIPPKATVLIESSISVHLPTGYSAKFVPSSSLVCAGLSYEGGEFPYWSLGSGRLLLAFTNVFANHHLTLMPGTVLGELFIVCNF